MTLMLTESEALAVLLAERNGYRWASNTLIGLSSGEAEYVLLSTGAKMGHNTVAFFINSDGRVAFPGQDIASLPYFKELVRKM